MLIIRSSIRRIFLATSSFAMVHFVFGIFKFFHGTLLIFLIGGAMMLLIFSITCLAESLSDSTWISAISTRVITSVLGITIAFCVLELFITNAEPLMNREDPLVMPSKWQVRLVKIQGSKLSYYWNGHLHVHNELYFRTTGSYKKDPDCLRIVVLGDSLTYGYGIAAENTYSSLLQEDLSKRTNVHVYNLGASGAQSEDVYRTARRFVPTLEPQIVIYGICVNDFLPSRTGEYASNLRYPFPLPRAIKQPLEMQTRLGPLFARGYDQLLLSVQLRNNFQQDILSNFRNHRSRFQIDLKHLNHLVLKKTGKSSCRHGFAAISRLLRQ